MLALGRDCCTLVLGRELQMVPNDPHKGSLLMSAVLRDEVTGVGPGLLEQCRDWLVLGTCCLEAHRTGACGKRRRLSPLGLALSEGDGPAEQGHWRGMWPLREGG